MNRTDPSLVLPGVSWLLLFDGVRYVKLRWDAFVALGVGRHRETFGPLEALLVLALAVAVELPLAAAVRCGVYRAFASSRTYSHPREDAFFSSGGLAKSFRWSLWRMCGMANK